MLGFDDINVLGGIIDATWGKSSTAASGSPQWSVSCKMLNDTRLMMTYQTIANLGHPNDVEPESKRLEKEGMDVIKEYVSATKKQFKERSGHTLKIDVKSYEPSIEIISMSAFNTKKTALFRLVVLADYS